MGYYNLMIISLIFLFILISFSDYVHPESNCISTSENYTQNSSYSINLHNLLNDLANNTKVTNRGFINTSRGQDPDRVYVLALCHGENTSDSDCKECIFNATRSIIQDCNSLLPRGAISWLEKCVVKYSDYGFFGQIDYEDEVKLINDTKMVNVTKISAFETMKHMSDLNTIAVAQGNSSYDYMFANGNTTTSDNTTAVSGFAQCTRDVSGDKCTTCVASAINHIPVSGIDNDTVSLHRWMTFLGGLNCRVGYKLDAPKV